MYARLRGFGKMQDEAEHVFDKLLEHPWCQVFTLEGRPDGAAQCFGTDARAGYGSGCNHIQLHLEMLWGLPSPLKW
jgi:hypothetical protein